MSKLILTLFFVINTIVINAQIPFDCNGRMFRVLEQNYQTVLQEITIDQNASKFTTLQSFPEFRINGIAYNRVDNLIYGVLLQEPYALCRIDGNYQLEVLSELALPTDLSFVAGDIAPDGRHLVLFGFSPHKKQNILAKVDLQSPTYETTLSPISSISNTNILCADIAFHPTSNVLYGFDHREGRLITIDMNSMKIDNTTFPLLRNFSGNVPSLFFDHHGNLYGIGSTNKTANNRQLVRFDIETGKATLLKAMQNETFQDACSCPVVIDILTRVKQREGFFCGQTDFEITLINQTGETLTGLSFEQTFPQGVSIAEVGSLPIEGDLIWNEQTIAIQQLTLPHGRFSFEVTIEFEEIQSATFSTQGTLKGTDMERILGEEILFSDDPETLVLDDPTQFSVSNLQVTFEQDEYYLCEGETVELVPSLQREALQFEWSDGSIKPTLEVKEAGFYDLTVTSNCEEISGSVEVVNSEIRLDLGRDRIVDEGELITLTPNIYADASIQFYQWQNDHGLNVVCADCPSFKSNPLSNMNYNLKIKDQFGCTAEDDLQVTIKSFRVFAPTAFSPNGDNKNEVFFLQSRIEYDIDLFQVFDRWGNILFENSGGRSNDEKFGWNGRYKNGKIAPGVYLWQAKVVNKVNEIEYLKGEVLLVLHQESGF